VFAHTPGGEVPAPYWWIDERFVMPTDSAFLLMPALRVVYVPTGASGTYVAYDVCIVVRAVGGELGALVALSPEEFVGKIGRVADRQEREALVERTAVVLKTQAIVERMFDLGKHREALDAMRPILGPTQGLAGLSGLSDGIASTFLRILNLGDYLDAIVVVAAMAVFAWSKGDLSFIPRVAGCIGTATFGNRTLYPLLVKAAVGLGSMAIERVSPRIAKLLVHNRSLACAIALAVSVLSTMSAAGAAAALELPFDYAVGPAAAEAVIGCAGEMGGEMGGTALRQAGELIASVAFVAIHLSQDSVTSAETATIAAESIERIVAARFGTCLVPRSIIAALIALRAIAGGPEAMFREYLTNAVKMGSVAHKFALCVVAGPSK
jgi:hypothetical protein